MSEHFAAAGGGRVDVHEHLDGGGLARAVGADQAVDAAGGHVQVETVEHRPCGGIFSARLWVRIAQVIFFCALLCRSGADPAARQCAARASVTSRRPMPSLLASTTSCSTSFSSRRERSAAVEPGGSATTVPVPGITSSSPSFSSCVTTLCAVLGLIFSAVRERPHRRKGIAGPELSGNQGLFSGIDHLLVERGARPEGHPERNHRCIMTGSTVGVKRKSSGIIKHGCRRRFPQHPV